MAIKKYNPEEFLGHGGVIIDVRSPSEYAHAHIPGAINMPLFDDEERKIVGTTYKQESRELAIKIGLDYFGPKMRTMVETIEKMGKTPVMIHCWRGGMRSGAVAWLLDIYGLEVGLLEGGYKAFRNWVLDRFRLDYELKIIGGYTGSAKTYVLQKLQEQGHSTVDLEGIANHKGSALGGIGQDPQPSQEMFENLLACQLSTQKGTILLEDESQRIGNLNIPANLFMQMRNAPVLFMDIPFAERLKFLVTEYGKCNVDEIKEAIWRIQKRLGGLETKNAIQCLDEQNFSACFEILLRYYDKWYQKDLDKRMETNANINKIALTQVDVIFNTEKIADGLTN